MAVVHRSSLIVPASRGGGVAQRLLEAAEGEMRAWDCRRVTLDTTQPLQRAIHFYERNGYRPTGVVADFFGMPLYQYRKELR
jgi:GNAT superfamily N-acetyltransferase